MRSHETTRKAGGRVPPVFLCVPLAALIAFLPCQARLRRCDLLFHVAPLANRITEVTNGGIDHVAIVIGRDSVIEAISEGVVITPLDSLYARPGYWLQGRVTCRVAYGKTLERAHRHLGQPYDSLFLADNGAVYCSELVQISFVNRRGALIFHTVPMSFHNADGHITDYWRAFYARQGMEVPEGQPGTNPQELSQRVNIRIIGIVEKKEERRRRPSGMGKTKKN